MESGGRKEGGAVGHFGKRGCGEEGEGEGGREREKGGGWVVGIMDGKEGISKKKKKLKFLFFLPLFPTPLLSFSFFSPPPRYPEKKNQ